jgi:hypothetical protein
VFLTALAAEMKEQFGARDTHVPILHGGKAEGVVLFGVFVVAHPDETRLQ